MTRLPSFTPLLLAVAVAAVLALGACAPAGQAPQPSPASGATAKADMQHAVPEFDRLFIDMMVPHHQGAVEMALIARQRAEHPEIKQLAEDIVRAQETEIAQMRQWRQQWYGSGETPPMSQMPMLHDSPAMGHGQQTMNMAEEVERLRAAPEPFDRAFIDAMIPHHQSAIDAARLAEQQAQRPEIKDLAREIIEAQQREIDQMRQWREAWYGVATG